MKSPALQEMIKRIFSDEQVKEQFKANPEGVISQFELTETEKKAVLATHARLGLITGNGQLVLEEANPVWLSPTP